MERFESLGSFWTCSFEFFKGFVPSYQEFFIERCEILLGGVDDGSEIIILELQRNLHWLNEM